MLMSVADPPAQNRRPQQAVMSKTFQIVGARVHFLIGRFNSIGCQRAEEI
jgi:hypothetical protein